MATLSIPPEAEFRGRLFTAADLAALPSRLPSGDVDFELRSGRLILMVPPGHVHGSAQARLTTQIGMKGELQGHGRTFTEVGVVLARNPDTVLAPDLAFIGKSKLPVRESREGYLETIPDLVVEIRSKNDTSAELDGKAAAYLSAGVRVVWVVEPNNKTVAVHRPGDEPQVHQPSDIMTLDDLIPGFALKVADIFST